MSYVRFIPIAVVATALAGPAAAQDWKGMGRMEGKVTDADGKAVPDVTVKLELPARGGGTTVKTDKKGKWAIAGIASGAWNIDLEAAGYVTKRITVNLPGELARIPPVVVQLEKAKPTGPPPEVLEAVSKGDEAFKAGRYAEAREQYEKLLALRPDLGSILHKQIAFTYAQEKNHARALEHLQKVLEADPANTEVRTLAAMTAIEAGEVDKGLELLKGVDESQITSPEVFFNVGVQFRNLSRPEEAVAYFTKSVTVDPTYVDGYFQRALTYLGLGKTAEAKADFQKVVELAPQGEQATMARKALEGLK